MDSDPVTAVNVGHIFWPFVDLVWLTRGGSDLEGVYRDPLFHEMRRYSDTPLPLSLRLTDVFPDGGNFDVSALPEGVEYLYGFFLFDDIDSMFEGVEELMTFYSDGCNDDRLERLRTCNEILRGIGDDRYNLADCLSGMNI